METEEIYWANLISDIQSILVLNQAELASECNVTQQTVSNWMNWSRIPRPKVQSVIFELAKRANIEVNDYNDEGHRILEVSWRHLVNDVIKSLKLKQSDFATKCDVTQQTVSLWKSGKRSPNFYAQSVIKDFALKAKINLNDYQPHLIKLNKNSFSKTTSKFLLEFKKFPKQKQLEIREELEFIIGEKS